MVTLCPVETLVLVFMMQLKHPYNLFTLLAYHWLCFINRFTLGVYITLYQRIYHTGLTEKPIDLWLPYKGKGVMHENGFCQMLLNALTTANVTFSNMLL